MVETALCVGLLAMTTVAMAKLAQNSASLNRLADQRLAARLVGQNAIERLDQIRDSDLADQAESVAQEISAATGCNTVISVMPFGDDQDPSMSGLQVRVDVQHGDGVRVTQYDWRLTANDEQAP